MICPKVAPLTFLPVPVLHKHDSSYQPALPEVFLLPLCRDLRAEELPGNTWGKIQ